MSYQKENRKIKVVIATVHGIESYGKNMLAFSDYCRLEDTIAAAANNTGLETHYANIVYGRVSAWINRFPILRDLVADNVALELKVLKYRFPNALIVLVAHSNGTWATKGAIVRYYREFNLDLLILLGCVMKRGFRWSLYPSITVINYVGKRDWIVFLAKPFYAMGWAGVYGFKHEAKNLRQIETDWGHTGFVNHFSKIRGEIEFYLKERA